eukprot:TRINITY_DN4717_c0_g1_i1.p1 TRINITY_DN4717_c0_g1~~TRINITY_DN4717_c0_g1_i1.p1  ORF type:complete len:148 (+),score=37.26 TRINITY_DN4717_c0_g1_i1:1-444(+)
MICCSLYVFLYFFFFYLLYYVYLQYNSVILFYFFFFFQAEDGIRDAQESRGLGDVYKRQPKRIHTDPQALPSSVEVMATCVESPDFEEDEYNVDEMQVSTVMSLSQCEFSLDQVTRSLRLTCGDIHAALRVLESSRQADHFVPSPYP